MIKYNAPMKHGVGSKSIAYNGRSRFRITDEKFKKALLALGVFTEDGEGMLFYSMPIIIKDIDGKEHDVQADGYLDLEFTDLPEESRQHFI